jgi:hypothetical protein
MEENPYQSPQIQRDRPSRVRARTMEAVIEAGREERRRNTFRIITATGVFLLVLLYVLSFGPYYAAYGMGGEPALGHAFYAPLWLPICNSDMVSQFMQWYGSFWL